jgi:cobalt-zinc-cadmium efflux system outer membrane protein
MNVLPRLAALAATIGILNGCAVTSLGESADDTVRRVAERASIAPAWPPDADAAPPPLPAAPLDLPSALVLAFAHNPEIRRHYARLGIAQAELQAAARIANPTISLSWLNPSGGGGDKTTRGIAMTFTDLLLLPSRRRLSAAELQRTELAVAWSLMTLAKEVEIAWYDAAGTAQAASLHDAAAEAAATGAALAARYQAAGNIPQLALDEERAEAARARIAALGAQARASDARARLANLIGLRTADGWRTTDALPAPPEEPLPGEGLAALALTQRFDLAAAHEEIAIAADRRATTGRWRLLGPVTAGYERERETDGDSLHGPTLALSLPVFDQGQGEIARADARVLDAHARRDALALAVENEVAAGVARLELRRAIAAEHRVAWLPAAASAVERRQERVNFTIEGVFTLLRARQQQYEATAHWLEAVRDYWIARAELRAAVGGPLPGDDAPLMPAIDADSIVKPAPDAHAHHGEQP